MNREEEENRRRCVTEAMHHIPLDVDYHDGFVVLTVLYDIGWLKTYFRQREEQEQDDLDFQFRNNVKTDSFGRITYFDVPHPRPFIDDEDDEDDNAEMGYYDLPPSVSHLRKLKKIGMTACQKIPVELCDLPCLTEIKCYCCDLNLFDEIPVGFHFPHLKYVRLVESQFPNSSIRFFNSLPNGLQELRFDDLFKDETDTIIFALQNYELNFHQSLTTLCIEAAEMDNNGFEKLLFEVVPRFPNLRNLSLNGNNIKSLHGAEKKIRELGFVSDTKLTKLDLHGNDIFYNGVIVSSEYRPGYITTKLTKIDSIVEKSAALLLLNTFSTIFSLGAMVDDQYNPDIEGVLRKNRMKRPFTDEGITGTWPSNAALWPFMLKKVYNNSWKVYDDKYLLARQESKDKKKCATELFHMVRYGPIFAVDQCPQHEVTTATTAPATKKQRTKK